MAVDFYNIFSPCATLYPMSLTVATTSSKKIHKWFTYRLYILLLYIAVVGTLIAQTYKYTTVYGMPWTIINIPTLLSLHSTFYTILLAQSIMGVKKNKMEKLMDQFNEMDDKDYSINDRKYKIYNAVFAVVILFIHVGCTMINIFHSEVFVISLTFISLLSDSEILVLNSFVSILNAKMAHLTLKLENIVKKKEAKEEDLYDRYRKGLLVVKRINNFWQARIFTIIIFELYFSTRTVMRLFAGRQSLSSTDTSVFTFIAKYLTSVRHGLIFAQLGLTGQWMADRFDQIGQLANTVSDMDLGGDDVSHQTLKIARLAAVSPGRLHAGPLTIDGQLPLRAASAVISTVILMLQFGVSI